MLDFGCGAGLSTEVFAKVLSEAECEVEIYGVDINAENLKLARERLPSASFEIITMNQSLKHLYKFDFITCNFVLLELKEKEMLPVLKSLEEVLDESGVLLVTNTTAKVYKQGNEWM